MIHELRKATESGLFSLLDYHFAKLIGKTNPQLLLMAALTSRAYGLGHSVIPLKSYLYQPYKWFADSDLPHKNQIAQALCAKANIDPKNSLENAWEEAISVIKNEGNFPLTATDYGIYLTKNYTFETRLINFLKAQTQSIDLNSEQIAFFNQMLNKLFSENSPTEVPTIDWQKIAAANTLLQKISIISGGPGTGKTTTVTKILLLLITHYKNSLKVILSAPTGKAAARLMESIEAQKSDLSKNNPELIEALKLIPNESVTLHRLLGIHPLRKTPKYNKRNPLHCDLLIIDEASMIDLHLFVQVIDALPVHARLIILGDKDQLSSVEAGAIMAELCQIQGYSKIHTKQLCALINNDHIKNALSSEIVADARSNNTLSLLKKSHRFSENSAIGQLAFAVNSDQNPAEKIIVVERLFDEAKVKNDPTICYHEIPFNSDALFLIEEIKKAFSPYQTLLKQKESTPQMLFCAFNKVRILCAKRVGNFGVVAINEMIERLLFNQKNTHNLYHGQAIMIMQNDYENGLYNGDIGIILEDQNHQLRAYFESKNDEIRTFSTQLLPLYESAFAMTIHKSQGSEFDQVLLVLSDHQSALLTTELLYTGITRAKKALFICSAEKPFHQAITERTKRFSGIANRLFGAPNAL